MRSYSESKIGFGDNSFDVIRLLAAIQVVLGHSFYHFDILQGTFNFLRWFPGVVILFVISGYLIPASFERSANNRDFLKKRILRIYPGLLLCFLVTFTLVMVLYRYNFSAKEFIIWIGTQTTFLQFYTPEFLRNYGTGVLNGSLWTIIVELQFYIVTVIFYGILKKLSITKWIVVILFFVLVNVLFPFLENKIPYYYLLSHTFVPYIYIFLIGAFIYTFKDKILPILLDNYKYLLGLYLVWSVINEFLVLRIGLYVNFITGVLLPILVITTGYLLGKCKLSIDLSYGLYLYHLVVINAFVHLKISNSILSLFLVYLITLLLSLMSWYLVEKPFMSLKKMGKNKVLNKAS